MQRVPNNGYGVKNLHSVWDSIIYKHYTRQELPLSFADWDWYTQEVFRLEMEFPVTDDIKPGMFNEWSEESISLAEEFVYHEFVFGETISDLYIKRARPVLQARMVLAGRRLAELIMDIYRPIGSSALENQIMEIYSASDNSSESNSDLIWTSDLNEATSFSFRLSTTAVLLALYALN